jgi:hypothetical protein
MRNKYGNIKVNGFDSKKEARRATQLEMLAKAKVIKDLQFQVKFELQPPFRNMKGEAVRKIEYICDFYYYDNEKKCYVAEDAKGFRTKDFILKSKIFQYKYPKIYFLET